MRVFVSSTVFDLIDIRAEVASQLRSMGIVPVMSDDKLSDFRVEPHEDSIETCLVNLDSCDEVILILDRRYGPRLGRAGFEDVSATHLEYRRAVEKKKPLYVFVRDRTEAEYGIWKKKKREPGELVWVDEDDFGIFELLGEHRRLQAQSRRSNWFNTFTSSVDLKAAIAKRFEARILPQRLIDAIQRNEFPVISVKHDSDLEEFGVSQSIRMKFTVKNVGGAPAFDFRIFWDDSNADSSVPCLLAPGDHLEMDLICPLSGLNSMLCTEYQSAIGLSVSERYLVSSRLQGDLVSICQRVSQQFHRVAPLEIHIEGVE